jgi:hypothetical protein
MRIIVRAVARALEREEDVGSIPHVRVDCLTPQLGREGRAQPCGIHGGADRLHPVMVERSIKDGVAGPAIGAEPHESLSAGAQKGVE